MGDLIKAIELQEMVNKNYQTRIWKHDKNITLDFLFEHIMTQCKPLGYDVMKIKGLGKLVEDTNQKIGDLNPEEGDYYIL